MLSVLFILPRPPPPPPPAPAPASALQVRVCDACVTAMQLPKWDDKFSKCARCSEEFTLFFRKHHCRNCGDTVCGTCSPHSIALPHFGFNSEVRVCTKCFSALKVPVSGSGKGAQGGQGGQGGAAKGNAGRRQSVIAGVTTAKVSIPQDQKQALLFAVRSSDRDLWLCAENMVVKQNWVNALDSVITQAVKGPAADPLEEWEIDYSQIQARVGQYQPAEKT